MRLIAINYFNHPINQLVGWQEGHQACEKNWVAGYWHG